MVNAFVLKADLDSEMTVVRNEFEMGENEPGAILYQRMQRLAFSWHNYGYADHRLARRHRARADRAAAGLLPHLVPARQRGADRRADASTRRARSSWWPSTSARSRARRARCRRCTPSEPTQDGERSVTLRRTGDMQIVGAMYRVPGGAPSRAIRRSTCWCGVLRQHAERPPAPRAWCRPGLASAAWGAERGLHDPGVMYLRRRLAKDASLEAARSALLEHARRASPRDPIEPERGRARAHRAAERLRTGARRTSATCAGAVRSFPRWATGGCSSSTATGCAR